MQQLALLLLINPSRRKIIRSAVVGASIVKLRGVVHLLPVSIVRRAASAVNPHRLGTLGPTARGCVGPTARGCARQWLTSQSNIVAVAIGLARLI